MRQLASAARRTRKFWADSTSASPAGLFGVPALRSARDWETVALDCVQRCESAAEEIRATKSSPSESVLQLFDNLSNDICTVLDTCVLIFRNMLPQYLPPIGLPVTGGVTLEECIF
jgi:hypothetical protein